MFNFYFFKLNINCLTIIYGFLYENKKTV